MQRQQKSPLLRQRRQQRKNTLEKLNNDIREKQFPRVEIFEQVEVFRAGTFKFERNVNYTEDIEKLKKALEANNTDEMKSIMEELTAKMQAFAEELYKNVGANAQPDPEGAPEGGPEQAGGESESQELYDDDVIDADFDMVDDDEAEEK